MRTAVREVRGAEPPLRVENWLGDTASFGEKVPTVIFGPGGPPVYAADEHLTVDEIARGDEGLRGVRRPRALRPPSE